MNNGRSEYEFTEEENKIKVKVKNYRTYLNGQESLNNERNLQDIILFDINEFAYQAIDNNLKGKLYCYIDNLYNQSVNYRSVCVAKLLNCRIFFVPSAYLSNIVKPLYHYMKEHSEEPLCFLVLSEDHLYNLVTMSSEYGDIYFFNDEKDVADFITRNRRE